MHAKRARLASLVILAVIYIVYAPLYTAMVTAIFEAPLVLLFADETGTERALLWTALVIIVNLFAVILTFSAAGLLDE